MPRLRLALALALVTGAGAAACPFCSNAGQTLTDSVKQSAMILYGSVSNAKQDIDSLDGGTTDIHVELVLKDHPVRAGRTVVNIPRYLPPTPGEPVKYLVFCDVFDGKIDPYRGIQAPATSPIGTYLRDATALAGKDTATRLKFYLDFLGDRDNLVSSDAYQEFANADYKDFREMTSHIDPARVVGWLRDPKTPEHRFGLFGSMLGHCGKAEHVPVIAECLEKSRYAAGVDGLMAGYIMLDREAGYRYLAGQLANPKTPFLRRYAGLRTLRFFAEYRPELLSGERVLAAVRPLLGQDDLADMAVEDLRKWKRWDAAAEVVKMYDDPAVNQLVTKRAVIKYALDAPPATAVAAALLAREREANPERVKDVEEGLQIERDSAKAAAAAPAKRPASR